MTYLKFIVIAIATLALAGVVIFYANTKSSHDTNIEVTSNSTPTKSVSTEPLTPSPRMAEEQSQAAVVTKVEELSQEEQRDKMEVEVQARINFYFDAFTKEEQDQLNQIKSAHGYFVDTHGQVLLTYQSYLEYDDATLKSMAQHDDLMAIQILGNRASEDKNYSAAMQYYLKAASLGSLQDIENIKSLNHELLIDALSKKDYQKVQDLKLKIYSWLDIYKKRGGWEANKKIADFKSNPMFDTSVTPNEQLTIEKHTQTLYDKLENERQEKGLGPFNNRTPDLLKEYYELMSGPLP